MYASLARFLRRPLHQPNCQQTEHERWSLSKLDLKVGCLCSFATGECEKAFTSLVPRHYARSITRARHPNGISNTFNRMWWLINFQRAEWIEIESIFHYDTTMNVISRKRRVMTYRHLANFFLQAPCHPHQQITSAQTRLKTFLCRVQSHSS